MSKVVHPLLGSFMLIREIGHGSFATVFLARHEVTSMFVALKVFDNLELTMEQINSDGPVAAAANSKFMISEDQQQEIELIKREIKLMQNVWHPLVVNLFDCFEDQGQVMFLSEIIDGDNLLNYVNNNGALDEDQARVMFAQMLLIMDYVHGEKKIVHRDLKCENFIVDKYNNIHLIDFGFAKSFATDNESINALLLTTCGSPGYVAPEIIRNKPYDASVDIWSLGVILYAITHGQLPFDEASTAKLLAKVVNSEPQYDAHLSPELIDIIKQMLKKDPRERPTIEALKKHKWVTTNQNGASFALNDKAFKKFVNDTPNSTNGGNFEIDNQTVQLLGFSQAQKEQIYNDLKAGNKTELSLLYKIARKARVQDEIKNAPKMIFTPISRNPPQRFHTFGPVSNKFQFGGQKSNDLPDFLQQPLRQSQLALSQYPPPQPQPSQPPQQPQQQPPPIPQPSPPSPHPATAGDANMQSILNLNLNRAVKKRQTRTPASQLAASAQAQILNTGKSPAVDQQRPPSQPAPYYNITKNNSSGLVNYQFQAQPYRYSDMSPLQSNLSPLPQQNLELALSRDPSLSASHDVMAYSKVSSSFQQPQPQPQASPFASGQLPKSYQINSKHYTAFSRRASVQVNKPTQVVLVTPQTNPQSNAMNSFAKRKSVK